MKIELRIDSKIIAEFSEITVAGFGVSCLNVAAKALPEPQTIFQEARGRLTTSGITLNNLPLDPRIACWREASKLSGLKSSEFRSSPEQLARRVLKGGEISTPLPVVTNYCAISLKHLIPMGGYDVGRLSQTDIHLRHSRPGSDKFTPLGGGGGSMGSQPNIAVYAAGDEVLCWHFNHRDSASTCLTETTQHAVFFGEAIRSQYVPALRDAMSELASLLEKYGAVVGTVMTANADSPSMTLDVLN